MANTPPPIPFRAPLKEYERQAQTLLDALKSGGEAAAWRFKWMHPSFRGKSVADVKAAHLELADAQAAVALEHGFENWAALAEFTEAVKEEGPITRFEEAVEAVISGHAKTLQALLSRHQELPRARSTRRHHATLLHYVAANGVEGRRQKTPPNALEIAKILLDAGAEVDALADMYDHQCTSMSMLISSCHPANAGLQTRLAELLVDHGAALSGPGSKWQSALMTALAFGYLDTAEVLARRGAPLDTLAAAAGLGRLADTARLLPGADAKDRHIALALATQHGHAQVVSLLLDAGEDPNRYNPDGFHAHSTPLHQAVLSEHLEVVKLLADRGARLDIRDTIYQGTPLGWAIHCEKPRSAEYLRARGAPP